MVTISSKNMNQSLRKRKMVLNSEDRSLRVVLIVMEEIAFQRGCPHMTTMTVRRSFGDIMRFLCSRIGRKQSSSKKTCSKSLKLMGRNGFTSGRWAFIIQCWWSVETRCSPPRNPKCSWWFSWTFAASFHDLDRWWDRRDNFSHLARCVPNGDRHRERLYARCQPTSRAAIRNPRLLHVSAWAYGPAGRADQVLWTNICPPPHRSSARDVLHHT